MEELVFVYGTLMNKAYDGWNKLQDATTINKYVLFDGPYPSARPIDSNNLPNGFIKGELYVLNDPKLLDYLDSYEGHPDYYKREKVKIKVDKGLGVGETATDNGYEVEAWMYIGPEFRGFHETPISPDKNNEVYWR